MKKLLIAISIAGCLIACKKESTLSTSKSTTVSNADSVRIFMNIKYANPADTVFWQLALFGTDTGGLWSGLLTKTNQFIWEGKVIPDTVDISEFDVAEWHAVAGLNSLDTVQCNIWVNGKIVIQSNKIGLTSLANEFHFKD